MDVLKRHSGITGVSMGTIFVMMAGLYVVIKVPMNGEHKNQ